MKIQYSLGGKKLTKQVQGQFPFILTNKKGGYFFGTSGVPFSKFNGLFFPYTVNDTTKEWDMFKTVEFLGIEEEVEQITSNYSTYKIKKPSATEEYYLNHSSTLIYEVSKTDKPISLYLDCKKIYDDSTSGRQYTIFTEQDCIIIYYAKYDGEILEYESYIAIKTNLESKHISSWIKREYSLDKSRGDDPEKWVFKALEFFAEKKGKLVLAHAKNKYDAIYQATSLFDSSDAMKKHKDKYASALISHSPCKTKEDQFLYATAVNNFDQLISKVNGIEGIFAGLPWFFHYWSRDEAISLGAVIKQEQYELAKSILLRWLSTDSQRVANRFPSADLGSADATGWLYFRLGQLLEKLKATNQIQDYFTKTELQSLYTKLVSRISDISKHHMSAGLVQNASLETWMDTGENVSDVRSGSRIEIQALYIAMFNTSTILGKLLGKKRTLEVQKKAFIEIVRESFFADEYLWDGVTDPTIRPNICIAAYVAPDILTKKEWITCFAKILPQLELTYQEGIGLSTIDTSHYLFRKWHTGQTNESYHRGDSWMWINALTAIVLITLDKTHFESTITQLKKSLSYLTLWDGAVGSLAEISSADMLLSQGCFSQAWSYAMVLELLYTCN